MTSTSNDARRPGPGTRVTGLPALALAAALALALTGCASVASAPPPDAPSTPAQWHAPLPHGGQVGDLKRWWQQFNDPLLTQLIEAGQQASPSIAAARSRIEQARAARVASGAALLPSLDAGASLSRGRFDLVSPVARRRGTTPVCRWPPRSPRPTWRCAPARPSWRRRSSMPPPVPRPRA
jgi:hypothetical protein